MPITETVAAMEILASTSVPTLPPVAILLPPVVPSLVHEVSMSEITMSIGGSKLDDPHPNTTEHEVITRGAIDNYGKDTYIDSAHVRSTAYWASHKEIEHDTGVSLDNFPVYPRVAVKADGSNMSTLELPINRYVSDVRSYLMK